MGILGNYSRINLGAFRQVGGGAVALTLGNLSNARPGTWKNYCLRDGVSDYLERLSRPHGYRPRAAWRLAGTAGELAAIDSATATLSGTAAGALGRNLATAGSFTVTGTGTAQLVVSGSGASSFTVTAEATVSASKAAAGAASFALSAAAAPTAKAWGVGEATISVTATGTRYAVGNLAGDVTPFTELSPQSLAASVLDALLADHQEPGSVGEALSAAGSAGDPWISTIEGTLSARDVFRVLLSIAAGNATGLASGSYEYKGQDGTTVRVAGTIAGDDRTVTTVDGA